MSTDNRTIINDCDEDTGWLGDDAATETSDAGSFYQGIGALATQLSNADEQMSTTEDSEADTTFSLDWSDSTLYMIIKDNQQSGFSVGGTQFVIGDGTNLTGYDIGGNDGVGLPLPSYFNGFKLDVSVVVAAPGSFTDFDGIEASLDQAAITEIGYGTIHQAKALGASDNLWMDCFRYIANDAYALTINGGTIGTPETMADVVADDVTGGWGMVSNPLGSLYYFFAPTEWGEASVSADAYFTASGGTWLLVGDNGGGHTVGATHFPFRVIGNATDTISFVISSVVVVNTGTSVEFDCSSSDVDTLEIDGCTFDGLASFEAPASGGTSRFCKNTIFANCGLVTSNIADMSGNSYLTPTVAADDAALFYDEALASPKVLSTLDDSTFEQGSNAHHAITFGTGIDENITLTGLELNGFSSADDADGSTFEFLATSGVINLNLIGCTVDGAAATTSNVGIDDAAGITVTIVIDPVTTDIHVDDNTGANLENARVLIEAADGAGDLPFEETVTIVAAGAVASVSHTAHGMIAGDLAVIRNAVEDAYNGAFAISNIGNDSYDYTMGSSPSSPATGTIDATGALIQGLTNGSGDLTSSRSWGADQNVRGFVRKSTASPRFKSFPLAGNTVDSTNGLSIVVRMVLDE